MGFKKHNPGCICCGVTPTGTYACGIYGDNFNRANSDDIGEAWIEEGTWSIADNFLEGFSGDVMRQNTSAKGLSVSVAFKFSAENQTAKLYYNGPSYYVGITPSTADSTKLNFYLVYGGAIKSRVSMSFLFGGGNEVSVGTWIYASVCILNTQVIAYCGATSGKRLAHAPSGPMAVGGRFGLGVSGDMGNGPVIFDNFSIDIAKPGDNPDVLCPDCQSVACLDCSGGYSWVVDLSNFTGMLDGIHGTYPPESLNNCRECEEGLGSYLLEERSFDCVWSYTERFCDGYSHFDDSSCTANVLSITMSAILTDVFRTNTGMPCGSRLTIQINEGGGSGAGGEQCFEFTPVRQSVTYTGPPMSTATTGSGFIVMHRAVALFSPPNGEFLVNGSIPSCVGKVTQRDEFGNFDIEPYICPETITVTRVG